MNAKNWKLGAVACRVFAVVGLAVPLMSLGCASEEKPSANQSPKAIDALSEVQSKQRELAVSAKDKLFEGLLGALMSSVKDNGVASSIEVCKSQAPTLAKEVGSESNVQIGRTSFQLRNAGNVPPVWAEPFVKARVADEVNVSLDGEGLGVLLPIRLKATCLMCHGSQETIKPEVVEAIERAYPRDEATGFAEGDLRGYFWIEVPGSIGTATSD